MSDFSILPSLIRYKHHDSRDPYKGFMIDRQRCAQVGMERAFEKEYEAYWKLKLKVDRYLLGDEFCDDELRLKEIKQDRKIQRWLLTIMFPNAGGDPLWRPPQTGKYQKPNIRDKVYRFAQNKCFGKFDYAFEWTPTAEVLHVHASVTWVQPGGFKTMLNFITNSFKDYIYNDDVEWFQNVDLKKWDTDPLQYVVKNPEIYDYQEDEEGVSLGSLVEDWKMWRSQYGLQQVYMRKQKTKKSKKRS